MIILHVVAEMDPAAGGVCQAVRMLAKGLASLGVQSEVASLDSPNNSLLVNDTLLVHTLGPGKGPWFYSSRLSPWLEVNMTRFDVVLVHGLWRYHSYAANKVYQRLCRESLVGQVGTSRRPTLFVMPHGMLDPYFQRAEGRKLKAIRNWAYWKLFECRLIANAKALLFTCEEECRLAGETFRPYQPKRSVVVGLGVEAPLAFHPAMREAFLAKCPELNPEPYLLFLSRIHEKKGLTMLLREFERVISDFTETKETSSAATQTTSTAIITRQLLVAGPGLETSYGQEQQQLVAESANLRSCVHFPGMLIGEAKWGAFYGCEAFVLPSHQENFGIAIVEALACGVPVLISNQVNIWREIMAAGAGLVADDTPDGTQNLLTAWQRLSKAEKQAMGKQARECFAINFSIELTAHKLLSAIME